ncbi:MAG: hypothetical protein HC780_24280 [Leptolyngbyaceae cyanobacterium CSU_1_3]|nr:hypothetical protein [Leptolyngbyaceae cyanobacterium CSU_1_3]
MSKIYSTEELVKILAEERRACMNGQRLNLAVTPSGINPLIDRFVRAEGIQKFTAYSDFRNTVHQYQRDHRISGIVWQHCAIKGKVFQYPKIDDQLISLSEDRQILKAAKASIVAFWQDVTQDMDFYLSLNNGKFYQPAIARDIERILQRSEWASLSYQGRSDNLEVILQLGWGKPEEALYRRGFPDSGSESIHAVQVGRVPIG